VWQNPTGGATALLRAAAQGVGGRGERVAWIDGQRSLGWDWRDGPVLIRPPNADQARKAAEILLKSGGFSLVVVSGIDPDHHSMLRLSRMVHEGGGAFVAITRASLTASLRITSRYLLEQFRLEPGPFGGAAVESAALEIKARSPGWRAETVLHLPVAIHDLRLALDPELPDRRGALD
jgi:hypothetical protein